MLGVAGHLSPEKRDKSEVQEAKARQQCQGGFGVDLRNHDSSEHRCRRLSDEAWQGELPHDDGVSLDAKDCQRQRAARDREDTHPPAVENDAKGDDRQAQPK